MKLSEISQRLAPLDKYLPYGSLPYISSLIQNEGLRIRITKQRKSKYGDFKPAMGKGLHQITINGSLNSYHFFITLIHEIAHLKTWNKHKGRVNPHGKEWKSEFGSFLLASINEKFFPEDIKKAIIGHLKSIKSSTSRDINLIKALRKYDNETSITIMDIKDGDLFKIEDGRIFERGAKRRTRYECKCLKTNKTYLFNAQYQIFLIEKE